LCGITLPAAALMAVLSTFVIKYRDHPSVAAALRGVKPAVVGMLAFVVWDLAPTGVIGWSGALFAVGAFIALIAKVHPGFVMVGALALGAVFFRT
jgi:chromate transporter